MAERSAPHQLKPTSQLCRINGVRRRISSVLIIVSVASLCHRSTMRREAQVKAENIAWGELRDYEAFTGKLFIWQSPWKVLQWTFLACDISCIFHQLEIILSTLCEFRSRAFDWHLVEAKPLTLPLFGFAEDYSKQNLHAIVSWIKAATFYRSTSFIDVKRIKHFSLNHFQRMHIKYLHCETVFIAHVSWNIQTSKARHFNIKKNPLEILIVALSRLHNLLPSLCTFKEFNFAVRWK